MKAKLHEYRTRLIQSTIQPKEFAKQTRRDKTVAVVALLSFIALFLLLSFAVTRLMQRTIDLAITEAIQSAGNPALTYIMEGISWPGYSPQSFIIVCLAVLALIVLRLYWETLLLAAVAVSEELLGITAKTLFHMPRPQARDVWVYQVLQGYSFPSGHVLFYTCFFGFLWYLIYLMFRPRLFRAVMLAFLGLLILAVGYSRVYLGEHWASDAIGAYLLGSVVLIVFIQVYRWRKQKDLGGV